MPAVDIYTTRYCPYCRWAKALLQRKGVEYNEIDVTMDAERRMEMVQRANGRTTVPQIFINSTHIGGFDDMQALDDQGKLDPLLQATQEHPA